MNPGTIFSKPQFIMHDGTYGNKFFINLNDGLGYPYIFVLSTTKQKGRSTIFGCHNEDRLPNFHLPIACTCFFEFDTWVLMEGYKEIRKTEFSNDIVNGIFLRLSCLSDDITKDLIQCAIESGDLLTSQRNSLIESLNRLYTKDN